MTDGEIKDDVANESKAVAYYIVVTLVVFYM
jgi:hypothetical protein